MAIRKTIVFAAITVLCIAGRAFGYVDLASTLGKVLRDSQTISLVEVEKFSRDKGAVILNKVRDLRGQTPGDSIKHQVAAAGSAIPRHILEWAEPGNRAVLFVSGKTALVCLGRSWYQMQSDVGGWWKAGPQRPDLPLAYCGTISRLTDAIELMLAGKTAVITTVPHGEDNEAASFDLALNRTNIPGLLKLQRLRANLRMPQNVMAVSANAGYLVGWGQVGEEDIPSLVEKLKSADASVRGEAADDLRSLGSRGAAAAPAIAKLLEDPSPLVQISAAAALLKITPDDSRGLAVLEKAIASSDVVVRRHAVRAVGLSGKAVAPLTGKLASLLADSDELVRIAALQSVAALGRTAAGACDAVAKLLDDPQSVIDAADALGRIGPAARPILSRIAPLLDDQSAVVRWAAVRAMCQIGGPDAAPAVKFMIRQLPSASEVDGYNMMIYLGLLGPVAKDAIPAIQSAPVRQPALRPAALWAIEPENRFPWLGGGGFGFGGGPMQDADVAVFIYEAFASELGDHLRPASRVLAQKIMDGSAGDVPMWAYKLLSRFPDEAMPILTPALSHTNIIQRERATVALGYMGAAAAAAQPQLAAALRTAPTEREQRLIKWCLRQIGPMPTASR